MLVGNPAEIFEGAQIVLGDTLALGIHPAELPLCDGMTAFGGVLQRSQRVGRGGCGAVAGGTSFFNGRLAVPGWAETTGMAASELTGAPSNPNAGTARERPLTSTQK